MKRSEYRRNAFESLATGRIDEETFWAVLDQEDEFCEDDFDDFDDEREYLTGKELAWWEAHWKQTG